jgi:hypothetical protein
MALTSLLREARLVQRSAGSWICGRRVSALAWASARVSALGSSERMARSSTCAGITANAYPIAARSSRRPCDCEPRIMCIRPSRGERRLADGGRAPRRRLQPLTPWLAHGGDHSSRPPIGNGVATASSCTYAAVTLRRRSPRPGSGHRAAHSAMLGQGRQTGRRITRHACQNVMLKIICGG